MPLSYETSSWELDEYYRHEPRWGGAVARDQLPAKLGNRFYIVNLQPSTEGNGTHWCGLWNCNPEWVSWFDSFGEDCPPEDVLQRLKATGKKVVVSRSWLQSWRSDACGLYCCFYLNRLLAGDDPTTVVTDELRDGQQNWAADQRKVVRATRGVLQRKPA